MIEVKDTICGTEIIITTPKIANRKCDTIKDLMRAYFVRHIPDSIIRSIVIETSSADIIHLKYGRLFVTLDIDIECDFDDKVINYDFDVTVKIIKSLVKAMDELVTQYNVFEEKTIAIDIK